MARRSVTRLVRCLALCAVTFALAPPARADEDKATARELFRAAEVAFGRGEYRAAALAFEAANEKVPSGGAMYNAGVAWGRAGEPARAADALSRALASRELTDARLADAQRQLAALEKRLGVLHVVAPAGTAFTVAHLRNARAPRTAFLAPGEHPVHVVRPDGRTEIRVIRLAPAQRSKLDLNEEPLEEGPPGVAPAGHVAPAARTAASKPPWGFVLLGAGAVSAGTGVYLLTRGLSARDEFEDSNRTDRGAHDRAIRYRTWSTVTLLAGVAFAGTGTVLLLSPPGGSEGGGVSLGLGPGSLAVRGTL